MCVMLATMYNFISIHAPPRGATARCGCNPEWYRFQFTPLREGRRRQCIILIPPSLFQFTPLREGRPCVRARMVTYWDFNSRPSARGDTRRLLISSSRNYFNSRPSARGDGTRRTSPGTADISIHAPPRGATSPAGDERRRIQISIHAPPRGATRAAERRRLHPRISIHAPPRGATPRPGKASGMHLISIHAPPRGATSAPRQGKRHAPYFNSRPSARGDNPDTTTGRDNHISIHAPPRGATENRRSKSSTRVFQFTPLREGRRAGGAERIRHHGISIHAPPRGATAKDMQFLQIFCSTLTNQHGLTIVPRNLSRLFW